MNKPKSFPRHAKRAYTSPEFDVWEWPQKMFDGSTKTFRRTVQMGGVSIFAATGNKILLLEQQQPGTPWYFSLPGGALDKSGEHVNSTAARELYEETGYKPGRMNLWKKTATKGRLYHERYFYIARNCKKVSDPAPDEGEKIKVSLVSFEQLLRISEDPRFFRGDVYIELLKCRADKKYAKALKQAIFRPMK